VGIYVVSASEITLNPVTLWQYLQTQLPDYMLHAAFVRLDDLPLTLNGKVDRQNLPIPEAVDRIQSTSYVAPRTVLEELLVQVWQEVFKLERIGIHDHFFELGGHSLLATQVVARLRHVLEQDIPLRTLFEHPTVAQLASAIDTQLAKPSKIGLRMSCNLERDFLCPNPSQELGVTTTFSFQAYPRKGAARKPI